MGREAENRRPDSATPASVAPCGTKQSHKPPNERSARVNKAGGGCTMKQMTGSGRKCSDGKGPFSSAFMLSTETS